ncbi:Vasoactive intestinal polypeptide receptor, partial [Varanus komodoensis]
MDSEGGREEEDRCIQNLVLGESFAKPGLTGEQGGPRSNQEELSLEAKLRKVRLSGCRTLWDNITCWPAAPLGEIKVMPCPQYFSFFSETQGPTYTSDISLVFRLYFHLGNVSRNCTHNGWSEMYPAPYSVVCGYNANSSSSAEE